MIDVPNRYSYYQESKSEKSKENSTSERSIYHDHFNELLNKIV